MELERHIEILLLRNDCVIVPGFGGFTASHVTARFDTDDNMFIPPMRTLGFNQKLCVNDSLLVQSYTEAYDISYPEAQRRIAAETEELRQRIENESSYTMNDIGTLYRTENGGVGFTPCEAGVLTPDLYSLSSFEMKKIDSETAVDEADTQTAEPATRKAKVVTVDAAPVNIEAESNETAEPADEKTERTISIRLSVLRDVAAVIIAIVGFFVLSSPVNNSKATVQMSQMEYGMLAKLFNPAAAAPAAVPDVKLNATKNTAPKAETEAKEEEKTEDKDAVKNDGRYCIVLASQVTLRNAKAYAEQLAAKGYKAARALKEEGRSTKVVYGSYKTQTEAYNALNELGDSDVFADAWVYKVKE